jgi:hypothetical protein
MSSTPLAPMRNPPHPGELIREDVVKPLGLTVTRLAVFTNMPQRFRKPPGSLSYCSTRRPWDSESHTMHTIARMIMGKYG